jgi:hypothetical protein
MIVRAVVLCATLLVVMAATGRGEEKSPVYKTPQEVFAAAKAAAKKNDVKAFYQTLTPESREKLTAMSAMMGVMTKAFSAFDTTGKAEEKIKPIVDAMKKHGLTDEAMKKVKPLTPTSTPKEVAASLKQLAGMVKDPPGFIGDMMAAMKKVDPKAEGLEALARARLEDVKIDGDKATGTTIGKKGDKEEKQPLKFEKIAGSWRIVLPDPPGRKGPPKKPGGDS